MPIYDYKCDECKHEFTVTKSISNIDVVESCPSCLSCCDKKCRMITKGKEFFGEKPDEPFYSHTLGKWVKGIRDQRRQCKERGFIEVGNEDIGKLHDQSERERDRKSKEKWNDFINPRYEVRA